MWALRSFRLFSYSRSSVLARRFLRYRSSHAPSEATATSVRTAVQSCFSFCHKDGWMATRNLSLLLDQSCSEYTCLRDTPNFSIADDFDPGWGYVRQYLGLYGMFPIRLAWIVRQCCGVKPCPRSRRRLAIVGSLKCQEDERYPFIKNFLQVLPWRRISRHVLRLDKFKTSIRDIHSKPRIENYCRRQSKGHRPAVNGPVQDGSHL
jgi:hypothetical protein